MMRVVPPVPGIKFSWEELLVDADDESAGVEEGQGIGAELAVCCADAFEVAAQRVAGRGGFVDVEVCEVVVAKTLAEV